MTIVAKARADKQLIYCYRQWKSSVMTQPGPWGSAYNGYCAGMAMRWIKLRLEGKDFEYNSKSLEMKDFDYTAVLRQNIYDATYRESGYDDALKSAGLKRDAKVESWQSAMNVQKLASIIRTNGHYIIRLRGERKGHATALVSGPQGAAVRFFDANYGQFRVEGGLDKVKDWLQWFFRESGYANRFTSKTIIYRIRKR